MPAYFGLVVHAAQGQTLELATQRAGDGASEGRFAHAGRTRKAEDRPFGLRIELAHTQEFENAVLDFFQTTVVFIQDLLGVGYVQPVAREFFPGQFRQPVQIGTHHVGLGRVRVHAGQTAQLLVGLLAHVLGHAGLVQGGPQAFQLFFSLIVLVAKFAADGLELFAQKVVFLRFVHAFACRALNAGLHCGYLNLALQLGVDQHEAVQRVFRFKNLLRVGRLHAHVGGDEVGQTAGIIHALQHCQHVR